MSLSHDTDEMRSMSLIKCHPHKCLAVQSTAEVTSQPLFPRKATTLRRICQQVLQM